MFLLLGIPCPFSNFFCRGKEGRKEGREEEGRRERREAGKEAGKKGGRKEEREVKRKFEKLHKNLSNLDTRKVKYIHKHGI